MKEELTREAIEAMSMCSHNVGCKECAAIYFCNGKMWSERCKWLAAALLEEMDKPKVWDGAPEDAVIVDIYWADKTDLALSHRRYTREMPKTRARQIAEEVISENVGGVEDKVSLLTDLIETALEKYAAELKGEE